MWILFGKSCGSYMWHTIVFDSNKEKSKSLILHICFNMPKISNIWQTTLTQAWNENIRLTINTTEDSGAETQIVCPTPSNNPKSFPITNLNICFNEVNVLRGLSLVHYIYLLLMQHYTYIITHWKYGFELPCQCRWSVGLRYTEKTL